MMAISCNGMLCFLIKDVYWCGYSRHLVKFLKIIFCIISILKICNVYIKKKKPRKIYATNSKYLWGRSGRLSLLLYFFELYEKIITWLGHSFYPLGAL